MRGSTCSSNSSWATDLMKSSMLMKAGLTGRKAGWKLSSTLNRGSGKFDSSWGVGDRTDVKVIVAVLSRSDKVIFISPLIEWFWTAALE